MTDTLADHIRDAHDNLKAGIAIMEKWQSGVHTNVYKAMHALSYAVKAVEQAADAKAEPLRKKLENCFAQWLDAFENGAPILKVPARKYASDALKDVRDLVLSVIDESDWHKDFRARTRALATPPAVDRAAVIEECAKVAERVAQETSDGEGEIYIARNIADQIRALADAKGDGK